MKTNAWTVMTIGLASLATEPVLAADYFMTARPTKSDLYLYAGAGSFQTDEVDVRVLPFEATLFTPDDWEVSARIELLDYRSDDLDTSGLGDVQLSVAKYFRYPGKLDFVSVQVGALTAVNDSPEELHGDTDAFVRLRTQAGPTLAKFEGNLVLATVNDPDGNGGDLRSTWSAGIRSQIRSTRFGADVLLTNQDGFGPITSVDLLVMHRFWSGHALYLTAQKDLSGDSDALYYEVAFEWRFQP